jgi:chitodextrinase
VRVKGVAAAVAVLLVVAGVIVGTGASAGATQVSLVGRLTVRHSDDFRGRATFDYRLETTDGTYGLDLADRDPALPRTNAVAVRGVRVGNTISVAPGGLSPAPAGVSQAASVGTKKVAVILFTFADDTTQPYTPAFARGVAFTDSTSVANYYTDVSYGQLTLAGDVFGWYSIPDTSSTCDVDQWAADADRAARAAGVNLAGYDYRTYGFPWANACGWTGLADMPGAQAWLNGWQGMTLGAMAHELGHNLGTNHANSYTCTQGGARVALSTPSNCTSTEYGDPFSVMGGSSKRDQTSFGRASLGWLPPAAALDVTTGGTYTLRPIEPTGQAGVEALRIKRDATTYLLLELRATQGVFDNFDSSDPVVNGVTVRLVPSYSTITQSQLVDATPATATFADAPLAPGRSVTDPVSGATISVVSVTPGLGAAVQLTLGGAQPPPPPPSDGTPPSTPTSPSATEVDVHSISLAWAASSDNVGVTGYRVYRGGTLLVTTTKPGYLDTGLEPNTSYSYSVSAYDAAGNVSGNSATATAKTTDSTPPGVPSGLSAGEVDVRHIALSWGQSTDDAGVTGYKLYRNRVYLKTVTATSYTDGGLTPNSTYAYTVTARDAAGNESAHSNTARATTADTTPPSAPTLTGKVSKGTDASLSWSASTDNVKITAYRVSRNGILLATLSPGARSYRDRAVPSGNHAYSVTAVDAAGNGATSNIVTLSF